jgi:putative ABC transport system ATP-binding protein
MVLKISKLCKSYRDARGRSVEVLRGVSLRLAPGETLALTGESGSGKSTLLHLAGALDLPDSGDVVIDNQSVGGLDDAGRAALRRRAVGVVFQQFNLVPSLNVAQNIALQARLAGRHDVAFQSELTERLGLADLTGRFPETLSGGQQQRVAIARALLGRPAVLLADEPTGSLDEETAQTVLQIMIDLVAEFGTSLLLVTHSDRIANQLQKRAHLRQGLL